MSNDVIYPLLMLLSTFIAAWSQILLKKAAGHTYKNRLAEYLNVRVIVAYVLFGGSALASIVALSVIPLSLAAILGASAYVFVALLSYFILREKLAKRKVIGLALVILGAILSVWM